MNNDLNPGLDNPEKHLTELLTGFVRHIRDNRFNVGIQETLDSQRLAATSDVTNKRQLQSGLKSLLCSSPTDWERFDQLFDVYWQGDKARQKTATTLGGKAARTSALGKSSSSNNEGVFDVPDANALAGQNSSDGNMAHEGASAIDAVERKDFNQLVNPEELRAMEDLAERLAQRIRRRLLRRQRLDQQGKRIDMRRTLRQSLKYGGLPLTLSFRKRRHQIPRLVLLLDVSRSMSVYSYLFLRFARGILSAFQDADAYAFHTRLIHIGETLREPSRRKLAEKMALISSGWGGGTRIDHSLAEFNRHYARQVLNGRSVVIIVSDGYDTGEPEALVEQLKRIKRRSHRLIWVNPLLGQSNYSPSTRCMQAALPLIDIFAPGHNLESLAALEIPLSKL
ncbi:MAG: hypothetical protein ACI9KN_002589 [Gammaproteobacteria bacterium]|jgi:uncharacterized protein with von Willebrand factor type A (vWA) domain